MTLTWKRFFSLSFTLLVLTTGLVSVASAEDTTSTSATVTISQGLENAGKGTYDSGLTLTEFIGNLIQALLTATGILFLVLTVWGGIIYMTAAGDDTKIKKAKGMITSAIVGLIIIIGAYALTSYVVSALSEASTGTAESTP